MQLPYVLTFLSSCTPKFVITRRCFNDGCVMVTGHSNLGLCQKGRSSFCKYKIISQSLIGCRNISYLQLHRLTCFRELKLECLMNCCWTKYNHSEKYFLTILWFVHQDLVMSLPVSAKRCCQHRVGSDQGPEPELGPLTRSHSAMMHREGGNTTELTVMQIVVREIEGLL